MTPEQKYTERDLVIAKRDAAARARCAMGAGVWQSGHSYYGESESPCATCVKVACERYPLPLVKQPRVVKLAGEEYKVEEAALLRRCGDRWWPVAFVHAGIVTGIADLLACPDELVEETSHDA